MSTRYARLKKSQAKKSLLLLALVQFLGSYPQKGEALTLMTDEVDLYPRHHPELAKLLHAIGPTVLARISHIPVRNSHGVPTAVGANPEEVRLVEDISNQKAGEKCRLDSRFI